MTITESREGWNLFDNLICPQCGTSLPPQARYCSACGQRINGMNKEEGQVSTENGHDDESEVADTVRIPSLSRNHTNDLPLPRSLNGNSLLAQPNTNSTLSYIGEASTTDKFTIQPTSEADDKALITASPLLTTDMVEHNASQNREQAASKDIVGETASNIASTRRGSRPLQNSWLLTHPLVQRFFGNSLLRNSIYITGTGAAASVFGYFFWILATHIYSANDVGLGAALISAMTVASIVANLGMSGTLVQLLPRREAGYSWSLTFNAGLATGIIAGLLCGVFALVALPHFSQQFAPIVNQLSFALVFVLGVPLLTVSTLLDQTFIAERAAHNMLVRNVAVAVLKIPLMVLPVIFMIQVGALGIYGSGVIAMAIALVGALLLLLPRLKRAYCLAAHGIVKEVRSMLSSLTGNYFINLGGLSAGFLLPIFVTIRLTPADNAYYYTTTRVGDFILMGSAAVAASLFAEGSYAPDNLPNKVRSSAKIISLILGPGILVCFLVGPLILSIFGPSYAQHGAIVLRIEAISSIPDAITSVYVTILRVQNRLRFAALLNVGIGALMLALSWILLPVLGIIAVPVGVLIAETAGSLATGIDVIRVHRKSTTDQRTRLKSDSGQ